MTDGKKIVKKTLLACQTEGCCNTFEAAVNEDVPNSVRSLQPALEAHKAGWVATGGTILCPDCAARPILTH